MNQNLWCFNACAALSIYAAVLLILTAIYSYLTVFIMYFASFETCTSHNSVMQKRELVDLATVSDMEIKSDDIAYMCFPKEHGGGFEDPSADILAPMGEAIAETK